MMSIQTTSANINANDPKNQTPDNLSRECPKINVSLLPKSLPQNVFFISCLKYKEIYANT